VKYIPRVAKNGSSSALSLPTVIENILYKGSKMNSTNTLFLDYFPTFLANFFV
jgi:hypothetical protein